MEEGRGGRGCRSALPGAAGRLWRIPGYERVVEMTVSENGDARDEVLRRVGSSDFSKAGNDLGFLGEFASATDEKEHDLKEELRALVEERVEDRSGQNCSG